MKLIIWLLQQGTMPVPDVVDLYYKVGMAFLQLGRRKEATKCYKVDTYACYKCGKNHINGLTIG